MADLDAELARLTAAEFAHLGKATTFTPSGGSGVACRASLAGPDVVAALGGASVNLPDVTLRVARTAIPSQPKPGDTFTVGSEVFHVLDLARLNDDRDVWIVDVETR